MFETPAWGRNRENARLYEIWEYQHARLEKDKEKSCHARLKEALV